MYSSMQMDSRQTSLVNIKILMSFVFCTFMESELRSEKHEKHLFSGAPSIYIRSYQCAWHTGADLTHAVHKICHPQLNVYIFPLALVRNISFSMFFFWFYFHFSFCQNCRFPVSPIHHWLQPFNSSRGTQPPPTSSPLYEQWTLTKPSSSPWEH